MIPPRLRYGNLVEFVYNKCEYAAFQLRIKYSFHTANKELQKTILLWISNVLIAL